MPKRIHQLTAPVNLVKSGVGPGRCALDVLSMQPERDFDILPSKYLRIVVPLCSFRKLHNVTIETE